MSTNAIPTYDYVVIGSSPILVLEGIYQQRLGKSVAIFDDKDRLGGSWYVKELFGHTNVEVGCHFISNTPKAYQFLDQYLAIPLSPMTPQPLYIICDVNQAKVASSPIKKMLVVIKSALVSNQWLTCRQIDLINNLRAAVRSKSPRKIFAALKRAGGWAKYQYYSNGCGGIMDELQRQGDNAGVTFHLGSEVKNIVIQPEQQSGTLEQNGKQFAFRHMIISKQTRLNQLHVGDRLIDEPKVRREECYKKHYVFKLTGKLLKRFSYIDVVNDEAIKRISDVGIFVEGLAENEHLLCIDMTYGIVAQNIDQDVLAKRIFARLIDIKLISTDSVLQDHYVERYDCHFASHDFLTGLEKDSNGVIKLVDTTDIGKSLEKYSDRWAQALERQRD